MTHPADPPTRIAAGNTARPIFVLHDHRRPRPHFDLRLEQDGALRSWAVPRGLPQAPGQNRLAVAVADHDLEHAAYTDPDKSIADSGWWEVDSCHERRFVFVLHGRRSSVRYVLVHTGGRQWLLRRTIDQGTGQGPADDDRDETQVPEPSSV